jgi:hypothetical protein
MAGVGMQHRNTHLVLTVPGMSGVAALFLPFTSDISPMDAAFDDALWKLALPFFLSIPILAASIRWSFSGSMSLAERAVACTVALAATAATLSFLWSATDWTGDIEQWLYTSIPVATLVLGAFLLFGDSRPDASRSLWPVMALQVAYLANALFCLAVFAGDDLFDLQVGAYCVLIAVIAYFLQIVLALTPSRSRPGRNP